MSSFQCFLLVIGCRRGHFMKLDEFGGETRSFGQNWIFDQKVTGLPDKNGCRWNLLPRQNPEISTTASATIFRGRCHHVTCTSHWTGPEFEATQPSLTLCHRLYHNTFNQRT
ncbi:hypothetical protein BDN71DRAFT_937528 [Pleurotus eryngii]|uniref:Uncharacterized protein n=1 Tax=Pleurotus eryngii TaxID=5323 RepID=A0A9P5ZUX5_PLEER|nr:hypothetical protein BDN71DRAFT_937528 [Pleurotus eryngii]